MKILIVNTYHYLRGGDCRHAFDLEKLLKKQGHEVHHFAMQGKTNLPCADEHYFIKEIDYRDAVRRKNPLNALKVVWHSFYSVEARKNIAKLLDEIKPDIAHLHSIRHHITKSVLPELAARNIPVVWTLHDYKEICPNTSFYDGQGICEKCGPNHHFPILRSRCKKGSLAASLLTFLEAKVDSYLDYDKFVNLYISPSRFLKDKFKEFDFPIDRMKLLPNFLEVDGFPVHYSHDNYLLFLGRLEKEKGIATLIKGFSQANTSAPSLRLKIAGTGSCGDELRDMVSRENIKNVDFLGYLQGDELEKITMNAKAIVIPSEWYENYPFSGLEAMAYGKPIIASRIGGIPEQVEDGITGFLYAPFNSADLAEKILHFDSLPQEQISRMGRKAREKVEKINNPHEYLGEILYIYGSLLGEGGKP